MPYQPMQHRKSTSARSLQDLGTLETLEKEFASLQLESPGG